jgi:hypothetical protein
MPELPRQSDNDVAREIQRRLAAFYGREPRWRYFQRDGGPLFVWTVEPFGQGGLLDVADGSRAGRYASLVYEPIGPGSRSGRATSWRRVEKSESLHQLRKDAKARALRLFRAWQAGDRKPWQ